MPFDSISGQEARALFARWPVPRARFMEVCGTHTMAIAQSGLKSLLPDGVEFVSGPGCPVCVTASSAIEAAFSLAKRARIVCYGDMLRVPGDDPAHTLWNCRAAGARVDTVYSAMDAVELAAANPDETVIFLAVGFETTAVGAALAIREAKRRSLSKFYALSFLKPMEPALRVLLSREDLSCDGLLLPGHVAAIIGETGFDFLKEFSIPAVIAGFETDDLIAATARLLKQVHDGTARIENEYTRVVRREGNPTARAVLQEVFTPCDDLWRGLGVVKNGGFALSAEYAAQDAWRVFDLDRLAPEKETPCRCADVITATIRPADCPLFGTVCTPQNPTGPCMVSQEGTCAAAFRFERGC